MTNSIDESLKGATAVIILDQGQNVQQKNVLNALIPQISILSLI